MRDALASLVVNQRGGAVCDERVLLLQRRRSAAMGELIGQMAELLRVGQ